MKHTIAFIIVLAFAATAYAQRPTIAKGDNVITIAANVPADSAFLICSKYLIQNGYSFESRDASLGQIVTNPRSYAGSFNYKLNFVFVGSNVKVRATAQVMSMAMSLAWTDWSYAKMKSDLFNEAYRKFQPDVQAIAQQLKGNQTYSNE